MVPSDSTRLNQIRADMLNRILGVVYVVSGITVLIAITAQLQAGEWGLALFYVIVYGCFVAVTLQKFVTYFVRVFVPLVVIYAVVLSEFYYFGTTALAYTLMYTLILLSGVYFGSRGAFIALGIVILSISVRYWARAISLSAETGVSVWQSDIISGWLSPMSAFITCAAIAIIAITTMLNRLIESLDEKDELIGQLETEMQLTQQAQGRLKISEDQYGALFDNSNDAVFLVASRDGSILQANSAADSLIGSDQQSSDITFLSDLFPEVAHDILQKAKQTQSVSPIDNVSFDNGSGSPLLVEIESTPVDEHTVFVIARDVTDRKSLEQQVLHSQKMDAVGQLAGGIAHDFNNSLQAIISLSEISLLQTDDPEIKDRLKRILSAGGRTRDMISQLLAFSRRQVLEVKTLVLSEAIEDSLHLIRRVIGEHIQFDFIPCEKELLVDADRAQLDQVMMNLCINSRDAMGDKGVLSITVNPVELDRRFCNEHPWALPGKYAKISVTDDGEGIEPENLEKVFEPFYTTKSAQEGTGLGLSTVIGIVEQHKGFINIESSVGEGTQVEVFLPLSESDIDQEDSDEEDLHQGRETVLLADDDELVLDSTAEMLEFNGYRVLRAGGGAEALVLLKRHKSDIDLAILDVVMPDTGGGDLLMSINEQYPDIPVLFVSGYSPDIVHNNFVLDSSVKLIQKPFKQQDLLKRVRSILDQSGSA